MNVVGFRNLAIQKRNLSGKLLTIMSGRPKQCSSSSKAAWYIELLHEKPRIASLARPTVNVCKRDIFSASWSGLLSIKALNKPNRDSSSLGYRQIE